MTSTQDNKKVEQIREQKNAPELQAEQLKADPEAGEPEKARGNAAELTPAGEIRKKAAENNFFSLPWETPGADSREHQKIIEQLNAAGDELIKANSAAIAAGAIDKSNNIIDSTKHAEIERLAAATNKYNDLWARAILTDDKETILLFYSQLLLNNPIYGNDNAIKNMLNTINDHLKPGQLDALQAEAEKLKTALIEAGKIQQRADNVKSYLERELKKPKYKGATFYSLITARDPADLADPDDEKTKLLMEALTAAEAAAHYIKTPETIAAPLDKLNTGMWNIATGKKKVNLNIITTPHKADAIPTAVKGILYFDDDIEKKYHLSKELNKFDKLTASSIYSIWRDNHDGAGHCITTLTAIYKSTNKGKPNTEQLQKIHDSILKQSLTRLSVDNEEEAQIYNYDHFYIANSSLLEMREIQQVDRNGKTTESAILILAEPPAIAFSIAHGHELADVPAEIFKSGISETENNLSIQDYLIRRIAPEKNKIRKLQATQEKKYTQERQKKINKARELVILTETFYKNTGQDKDKKTKLRARNTALKYLNHYKSEAGGAWIDDAKISKDNKRIIIKLPIKK